MNETNRTYPNLVAKIQVYIKPKPQNIFTLLGKSGSYKNMLNFMAIVYIGAQWLSGRELDSTSRHRRLCVVSLGKNIINTSYVLFHPRKTRPFITE